MIMITILVDVSSMIFFFFFFNDTATTEIYTLSLHDALPISVKLVANLPYYITTPIIMRFLEEDINVTDIVVMVQKEVAERMRSEEHTSELQSRQYLVCRLLLEKKKKQTMNILNRNMNRTIIV